MANLFMCGGGISKNILFDSNIGYTNRERTGGWAISSVTNTVAVIAPNSGAMVMNGTNANYFIKPIDLTNYNKIIFRGTCTATYNGGFYWRGAIGKTTDLSTRYVDCPHNFTEPNFTTYEGCTDTVMDISDLSGEYYIGFLQNFYGSGFKIWLE